MMAIIKRHTRIFGPVATLALAGTLSLQAHADAPGRGATAQFEQDYLMSIIDHHYSALRITELAAGTDERRDAALNKPEEGTSPTPGTTATPAKAGDDEIKSMARMANRMQREEIGKAQRFLRDWYGVNHTPQLMAEGQQQIQRLEQAGAGDAFDRAFLETFINHHYPAIHASQDCVVKADIAHDELKHYCEGIVQNQAREINEMRGKLCTDFNVCDFQPAAAMRE